MPAIVGRPGLAVSTASRASWWGRPDSGWSVGDVEAEHHPALVVLGDVTVRHPATGVRDVEQDVDGLPRAHEHCVLPDEVRLDDVVAREDHKPAGTVDVERMRHRVI